MFAMIVLDTVTGKLSIIHNNDNSLKLVHSDQDAEQYVTHTIPKGKLLGTFPDPTNLIDLVMREKKSASKNPIATTKTSKKAPPRRKS